MSNLTIKEYKKAFVFEDNKNYTLAEKSYQIAVENDNNFGSKELGIGVLHQFYGFFEKAIKEYKKELEKDLKDESLDKIYLNLALCLDRSHFYEEAIFYYKKISTNEGFVNYRVSELYKKLKDFELSNNYLEKLKIKKIVPKFEWKHGISYGAFMQDERLKTTNYFVSLYEELEKVEDRAFFESFEARAFDNIAFDILENLLSKNYIKSAIFAIDDLRKIPDILKKRADIRFVLKDSLDYIEALTNSKLIVSNSILPDYFVRGEKQQLLDYSSFRKDFPKNSRVFKAMLSKNLLQATHILSKDDTDIFLKNSSISYIFDEKIEKYIKDFDFSTFLEEPKNRTKKDKKNILIYIESFINNKVDSAFYNFLKIIPKDRYDITLLVDFEVLKNSDRFEKIEQNISKDIKILTKYHDIIESLEEKEISEYLNRNKKMANKDMEDIFLNSKKREAKRFLGENSFDFAINFSGFDIKCLTFFAGILSKKKIVFSHFEKNLEDITRYSNLYGVFSQYRWFDTIVINQKQTNLTKEYFIKEFELEKQNIVCINNILDIEESKKELLSLLEV